MANTKSAIKTIRRITRQTKVNKNRKARFKNALKKMMFHFQLIVAMYNLIKIISGAILTNILFI